jgi:hypothetical protein
MVNQDQPSGDIGYGEIILAATNNGWRSEAGAWNDEPSWAKKYGIAEIPLGGTPTTQ